MALGKTIISTSIGAEGIHVENGKNILLADSPMEFLEAVKKCMADPAYCFSIGKSARELVEKDYSNLSIGKKLIEFYSQKH